MQSNLVITLLVFAILFFVGLLGWLMIKYYNSFKPEAERKWTDPKFRDHIGRH